MLRRAKGHGRDSADVAEEEGADHHAKSNEWTD